MLARFNRPQRFKAEVRDRDVGLVRRPDAPLHRPACAVVCKRREAVAAARRSHRGDALAEGAGGDAPKLIFDKGVLVGVDKQHIDYTKPGRKYLFYL